MKQDSQYILLWLEEIKIKNVPLVRAAKVPLLNH